MQFKFAGVLLALGSSLRVATAIPASNIGLDTRSDALLDCLHSSLSSQATIETPGQPTFFNDTARFSTLYAPTFKAVSKVANEYDVAASIKCATKTNTKFFVTGPRHGFYSGLQKIKDGLEIYTGAFDRIDIDPRANTLTVGGAVRFADAIKVAYEAKKNFPTGSSSCVGMLGAGLGGGIGRLQGLYGFIVDNILSVRIMLPNTTVVNSSQDSYPELFWGIRGAGFNFGFVLNATFRVYDQVPNGLHLNADFLFPSNITRSFTEKLAEISQNQPPALSLVTALAYNPQYNATTILANAVYAGPESEGRKAVQFLVDQKPLVQNISVVPWTELITTAEFGGAGPSECVKGTDRHDSYSAGFNVIDPEAHVKLRDTFEEMITKYPQTRGSAAAIYMPATQGVRAFNANSTSFPWRGLLGQVDFPILYSDNNTTDATIEYLPQKMRQIIVDSAQTGGKLRTWVGFSNGDESLESIFSKENLPRLAALKKEYDPHGLFNAYHPLPTSYP